MARGIAALALIVAGLILAAGIGAINARFADVRTALDGQGALARALLLDHPNASDLINRLKVPGVHAIVEDHVDDVVYDWRGGELNSRGVPPPPPGGPPPEGPGPEAPPDAQGPPRLPQSPLDRLIGLAVGRQPVRLNDGDRVSVVIAPDLQTLRRFVVTVSTLTVLGLVATISGSVWLIMSNARVARRRLEVTLEERRAAAREFQRFLADAGHELRTPLTIVSGYVEILSAELASTPNGTQILAGMRAETARMRALVEKMLLLARLESPVSVPRLVDARSVACDVVKQMQARYPARELVLRTTDPAHIVIDQDDLHEAVRNLVENALRYAPSSAVVVDVTSAANDASIAVTDHGGGITAAEQAKIFDRFYRGSAQTDAEGSGLGLAIVSRVASRWKGAVTLDSAPGRTMFTLRFPLAEEVPA